MRFSFCIALAAAACSTSSSASRPSADASGSQSPSSAASGSQPASTTGSGKHHWLKATPDNVRWGWLDPKERPRLTIESGDTFSI